MPDGAGILAAWPLYVMSAAVNALLTLTQAPKGNPAGRFDKKKDKKRITKLYGVVA